MQEGSDGVGVGRDGVDKWRGSWRETRDVRAAEAATPKHWASIERRRKRQTAHKDQDQEKAATPTGTHENTEIEEPSTAIELAHAWPLSAASEPSAAETATIANPARGPPLPLMPKFAMPTAAEQCEPRLPLSVRLRGGGTEDER